jgi:acetyl esterase/lipase
VASPESQAYLAQLRQNPAFGSQGFDLAALRECMATRREPTDPTIECRPVHVGDIPAEWVLAPGADPDVRLLYLHGGGYVSGSGAYYLPLAAHLSAQGGCAVLLPDYRLAPEHPFPTGVEDCVAAHEWLRACGPAGKAPARATFIAGDSAGGGLTLATLLALRDRGLPLPKAAIPISPFADLTLSGESIRSQATLDPIMDPRCLPDFVRLYADETEVRSPLASPLFGDYAGLPPLLIQVGEYEIIRDDAARVAERARADGVEVTLEVWEGMFHVFQSHEPLLPEGREAVARMAEVIRAG